MVLETSSESTNEQIFNNAPSSDSDPYSENGPEPYQLGARNLPRPVPFFGPLWGFTSKTTEKLLNSQLNMIHSVLNRYPTQDEAEALAYIVAKQVSTLSYYPPIGIVAGLWRSYQTASTFRFPFYQPNLDTFTPEAFPPRSPLLRGTRAVLAWHTLRTVPYVAAGLFFSQLFVQSYAASVSTATMVTDPRLKDVINAMKEHAKQKLESLQKDRDQRRRAGQQQHSGALNTQEDDSSPARGMWDSGGNGENTVEAATRSSPPAAPRPWPKVRPVPVESQTEDSRDQPFDAFDDASPTGGQGMFHDTESSPRQQTGSAWERIRRGEKSAANTQKPTQSSWSKQQTAAQQETSGDSFSFSKSEEERNYAQQEAQKEFDARVERESRGGDFSQNDGDQKRW